MDNEHILTSGEYIGVRQYYNYFINLYLWEEKFYEVWYFRPTNEIEKLYNERNFDVVVDEFFCS